MVVVLYSHITLVKVIRSRAMARHQTNFHPLSLLSRWYVEEKIHVDNMKHTSTISFQEKIFHHLRSPSRSLTPLYQPT